MHLLLVKCMRLRARPGCQLAVLRPTALPTATLYIHDLVHTVLGLYGSCYAGRLFILSSPVRSALLDRAPMPYAADDYLTEQQACTYVPIIASRLHATAASRSYHEDADIIYSDASISVHLSSLYTVFNPVYLRRESISCVVNMAGCRDQTLGYHYRRDCASRAAQMVPVQKHCGQHIAFVLAEGEHA